MFPFYSGHILQLNSFRHLGGAPAGGGHFRFGSLMGWQGPDGSTGQMRHDGGSQQGGWHESEAQGGSQQGCLHESEAQGGWHESEAQGGWQSWLNGH